MKHHTIASWTVVQPPVLKHTKRLLVVTGITLMIALTGCAPASQGERWTLFNNTPTSAAVGTRAKVVVYRKSTVNEASSPERGPAIIYVDGDYAASLLPMASTEVLVCPGQHRLSARANLSAGVLGDKTVDSMGQELASGSIKYFMVQYGEDATPRLFPVMPEQAVKDLSGMRRQVHTLPRVKTPAC